MSPEGDQPPPQPALSGEPPPTPQPLRSWPPSGSTQLPQPTIIHWELAWKGALIAGVGAGLLSAIPVLSLGCCLWLLGAGALSVGLYQRQVPGTMVTPLMGMRVGALAGVFGFVLNAVMSTLSFVFLRSANFRSLMQDQMRRTMERTPDPQAEKILQQFMDYLSTPQGMATFFVAVLVALAVGFVVFTAAGGALGASMFGPRYRKYS